MRWVPAQRPPIRLRLRRRGDEVHSSAHHVVDAREDAAQDVDLLLLEAARGRRAAAAAAAAARHARIEEAHRDERALGVRVRAPRSRRRSRARSAARARRSPPVARDAQLVAGDLHGGREVERRVRRIRGDRRDDAAARELVVRQSRHLGAEHERDVAARRVRDRLAAASRIGSTRPANSRGRAESPTASAQPASASSSVGDDPARRRARPSRPTPAPRRPASGNARGATSTRRVTPIVSIARAAAPMLPAWLVATSTMRIASRAGRDRRIGSPAATRVAAAGGTMGAFVLMRLPLRAARRPGRDNPTMHPMLTIAVKAARRAGNIINRGARDLDLLTVTAKGPKDFVSEVDRAGGKRDRRDAARRLSGPRDSSRGRHGQRRERRGGERLDHRPARRHDQLPARLSAVLRVDRARAPRPGHAGRHLRPGAQRPVHRDARPRRVPQRPAHPRVARQHLRECLIGTGFPFRDGSLPRHLPADDEDDDRADRRPAPAGRRRARSRLRRRRASTTASGKSASIRGTSPPAACWCRRRAGSSATSSGEGDFLHGGQVIAGNAEDLRPDGDHAGAYREELLRRRGAPARRIRRRAEGRVRPDPAAPADSRWLARCVARCGTLLACVPLARTTAA